MKCNMKSVLHIESKNIAKTFHKKSAVRKRVEAETLLVKRRENMLFYIHERTERIPCNVNVKGNHFIRRDSRMK